VNNNTQLKAAMRPLAGFGAGAFVCVGALAGSHAGDVIASPVLPRPRWASAGSAASAQVRGGYLHTSRPQFEQQTTLIVPVIPGGVGPHPVREPGPV
jgi:hypothetical protein